VKYLFFLLFGTFSPGSYLSNYNSLRDEHLATYNSDPKRLRHFRHMGLVRVMFL